MSGLVRDFWPCSRWSDCGKKGIDPDIPCRKCHPDFEQANIVSYDKNVVKTILPASKVPEFRQSVNGSVTNATTFSKWFVDDPDFSIPITLELTLTNSASKPDEYSYINSAFWPINNKGWGNWDDTNKNFHFTFQLSSRFTYHGGEVFKYTGDDDLWVFINNSLVIDLGGVHGAQNAEVKLDDLRLARDGTYNIDIFFAERHTSESNFKIYTSMEIFCPWKDHCGVCQGDGQSCCNCNDNNKCTTEKCNVTSGACIFTNVTCTPPDVCQKGSCSQSTGLCSYSPVVCPGANACNTVPCSVSAGGCQIIPRDCDDQNVCTEDSCDTVTGCKYTLKSCDDGDKCTIDYCVNGTGSAAGCRRTPVNCNDNDPCTTEYCDPATGLCVRGTTDCDDQDACTTDSCDSNGCKHTPVNCDDGNACTVDTCDRVTGCKNVTITCNDDNLCTEDSCDRATGCVFRSNSSNCFDTDVCTIDVCDRYLGCNRTNVPEEDCNRCKVDGVQKQCNTTDVCKPMFCVPLLGECQEDPVVCDDGNACTSDGCVDEGGVAVCKFTPLTNSNSTNCHPLSCNTTTGEWYGQPISCDDGNPCTHDTCIEGNNTYTCSWIGITCNTTNLCAPSMCNRQNGKCEDHPIICNDYNECTEDQCDMSTGNCTFEFLGCEGDALCHPLTCDPLTGNCTGEAIACDDSSMCTSDRCVDATGLCSFDPIPCDDGNNCTVDACFSDRGCTHVDVVCDDQDACTRDSCNPLTGCVFTPIDLNSPEIIGPKRDLCLTYVCDALVGVVSTPVECRPTDQCQCNSDEGCKCSKKGILGDITTEQAALGAGALAAIIIGAAAFLVFLGVGSKKGYDYFKQKDLMTGAVMSSALYEPNMANVENPLYENTDIEKN